MNLKLKTRTPAKEIYKSACVGFVNVILFFIAFCMGIYFLSWFSNHVLPIIGTVVDYCMAHVFVLAVGVLVLFALFYLGFTAKEIVQKNEFKKKRKKVKATNET